MRQRRDPEKDEADARRTGSTGPGASQSPSRGSGARRPAEGVIRGRGGRKGGSPAPGNATPGSSQAPLKGPGPVSPQSPGQEALPATTGAAGAQPAPVDELIISELVAPQGIKGAVRGLSLTDFPEAVCRLEEVILEGAQRRTIRVKEARTHGKMLLFQFEGVDSIEQAEALRGTLVKIPRSAAQPLAPGHFYISDIIGIEVFTEDGRPLGKVKSVLRTGSNDVYTTEKALIPATREAVTELDVPGRRMVVQSTLVVED